MSTVNPSLMMVGPFSNRYRQLGAEIYTDLQSAFKFLEAGSCEVLAVSLTTLKESRFQQVWQKIKDAKKQTQLILVTPEGYRTKDFIAIQKEFPIFRWRTSFEAPELEIDLSLALEKSRNLQQEETLNELLNQQTQELQLFQNELERRIEKRTKYLVESRRKLFLMNSRMEIFRSLLFGLQQASSLQDLESTLNLSLNSWMQIQWIKLLLAPDDKKFINEIDSELDYEVLRVPLYHPDENVGSLFFMKSKPTKFSTEEADFLTQVGEAAALALERLLKILELNSLKSQWDSTFAAISDPVLLINSEFSVVQSNQDKTDDYCYKILFGRQSPCPTCQRGEDFILNQGGQTYQVSSQKIALDKSSDSKAFINLYHNKSQELRMEAQILESARNAELGTIGSSIAHELNNPLGGLLTFLQMIKMDLPTESPLNNDIEEMEKGAQRCREIIQNLLVFTRTPDLENQTEFDLNELVEQALKISEIHAKGVSVRLDWIPEKAPLRMRGNKSLISQALRNFIQIGIDHSKGKSLTIQTHLQDSTIEWVLHVAKTINFKILKNTSFSWTLAEQILLDQQAETQLLSDLESGSTIKISFSRLVLES